MKTTSQKPRFIAHYGGPQPVGDYVRVEVAFRCGDMDNLNDESTAHEWDWDHDRNDYDIIAYRVLGESE